MKFPSTKKIGAVSLFVATVVISMNIWIVSGYDVCPSSYAPVCGASISTCTADTCSYTDRTYINSCYLDQSQAILLYDGVCSDQKTKDALDSDAFLQKTKAVSQTIAQATSPFPTSPSPSSIAPVPSNEQVTAMYKQVETRIAAEEETKRETYTKNVVALLEKQIAGMSDTTTDTAKNIKELVALLRYHYLGERPQQAATPSQSEKIFSLDMLGVEIRAWSDRNTETTDTGIRLYNGQFQLFLSALAQKNNNPSRLDSLPSTTSDTSLETFVPPQDVLASWGDKNVLLYNFLRNDVCKQEQWWQRTVSYHVLSQEQTHTNKFAISILYLCQERENKTESTPIQKSLQMWPALIDLLVKDDTFSIVSWQQPTDWLWYEQDVEAIFDSSLYSVLLWLNSAWFTKYNSLIQELHDANMSQAYELQLVAQNT